MMTVRELLALLESTGSLPKGTEPVDPLSHALQCAGLALAAGVDDELVVACALHDIGQDPALRARFPGKSHEEVGYHFLSELFSERVAWLVGAHVDAVRYLAAVEPEYVRSLSESSTSVLARRGGPLKGEALERFARHPWRDAAVLLRRWDDAAKDPRAVDVPGLDALEPLIRRTLRSPESGASAAAANATSAKAGSGTAR